MKAKGLGSGTFDYIAGVLILKKLSSFSQHRPG
uniref:Uncharacterized protein n=1 Tax=Rhizophora mucronata TaxID=61149 RepID=A0A2P2NG62_RHIMU